MAVIEERTHAACTYCERITDQTYGAPCPRCQQLAVAVASTPDWLLVKLIGPERLARIVSDRLKLEMDKLHKAQPHARPVK